MGDTFKIMQGIIDRCRTAEDRWFELVLTMTRDERLPLHIRIEYTHKAMDIVHYLKEQREKQND